MIERNNKVSNNVVSVRAQELEEIAEKKAGATAIQQIVEKHLTAIKEIRAKFPLDGIELLSAELRNKKGVIGEISAEVGRLHQKIRVVIEEVATTIENGKYISSEQTIDRMSLGHRERTKANALLAADKKCLVSCQSLNTAIEIFSGLNKLIKQQIEEAERAGDIQRERNHLLGNAVLVYELTDFLINYIDSFKMQGIDEIKVLYDESKRRNDEIKSELEDLKTMAQGEGVNPATRESTMRDIVNREKALEIVNAEWDRYNQQNQKIQKEIGLVGGNLPTLRVIRANAKSQIKVLEAVAVLQIVNNSLGALQQALKTLEDMELVSLSPERVRRLLGIDQTIA